MRPEQRAFFGARLDDERQQLLERAQGKLEQIQDPVSRHDRNDRANKEEEFSFEFRVRDRAQVTEKKQMVRSSHQIIPMAGADNGP
jgi:RNA polymerase-binding transcription factor DksA